MGGRGGNTVGHTTCLHVWPMVSLLSLQLMTFKITLNLRFLKYLPYRNENIALQKQGNGDKFNVAAEQGAGGWKRWETRLEG